MNIPESMPTLSSGPHMEGQGEACVMEYVALLNGESWTDTPSCTHIILTQVAQGANDTLSDEDRHLLIPLIGRLFGTNDAAGTEHMVHVYNLMAEELNRILGNPPATDWWIADNYVGVNWTGWQTLTGKDRVAILIRLLDYFDEHIGRTNHCEVTNEDLAQLKEKVEA